MKSYDVIVVGAGHNGLTCACYLAKAGLNVLVVERRPIAGGAVCTQTDLVDGFRLDVGGSAHIMIHLTPVVRDLELERFGLEYIDCDPWGWYPIKGTDKGIGFYKDVDRTCQSIAQVSERDAEAYRKFVDHWTELNEGVFETFLQPPTPGRLFWTMLKRNFRNWRSRKLWSSLDTSRQLMAPYGQVINELFENIHVRTALLWLSAQSGPAPVEPASGDMLGWNVMIHKSGLKRPRGGSGMLTQALQKRLESDGGTVRLNAPVTSIRQEGDEWVVTSGGGEGQAEEEQARAKRVVAGCHIKTLFGKLVDDCPADLKKRVSNLRVGNGFGMIVRYGVDELPMYGPEVRSSQKEDAHTGLQLLCPSPEYLQSSYSDFLQGLPPRQPSVVAMTFSSVDPTLAPPGKHTLFAWGQYHPYELSNGENWDDIAEREADKLYDLVCEYAPNMKGKKIGQFIQTPKQIEEMHGLLRGNVMHLEMSIDQMFMWRPTHDMCDYTTPLKNLYLTGASTHPGGGIFAASGYNTAQVVLKAAGK